MPRVRGSLRDLQAETGLTHEHISKIKKGRGVSLRNAVRLAYAMGITLDQFVTKFYAHYHPLYELGSQGRNGE